MSGDRESKSKKLQSSKSLRDVCFNHLSEKNIPRVCPTLTNRF